MNHNQPKRSQQMADQRWVSLDIKNVMGVKAMTITRNGPVTTIGGKNGQGKSSAIRSLWMVLGGAASCVDEPLREGAKKGGVALELTDYVCNVALSSKGKPKFSVKAKDGATLPAPATFLKTLTGGKAFNPAAFFSEKQAKQLETLREIVTLDTRDIDFRHDSAYEERTEVGRTVKALQARVEATDFHEGAPEAEVSVGELLAEMQRIRDDNEAKRLQRKGLEDMRATAIDIREAIDDARAELAKQQAKVVDLEKTLEQAITSGKEQAARVNELGEDEDWQAVKDKIDTLEDDNRKARENAAHIALTTEWDAAIVKHEELTATVQACDEEKAEAIASAKFPVEGLGFGDGCVLYNGRPLDQACGMERMRVSLGIGAAMNPGIKLMTIDDEEKLDEDEHANLLALAEEIGFDLIVARVSRGAECDLIIECGELVATDKVLGT